MIGQTVIFDGHRLNDRFYVGECDIALPAFSPRVEDQEMMDGSRVRGMRLGSPEIAIQLTTRPVNGEAPRDALSDLMAWLHVDGPRKLSLSGDRGLWRMCVPNGAPAIEDLKWQDRLTIRFVQVEPALYGSKRKVNVPSGGTVQFVVGGDYKTKPTISSNAVYRNSSSQQWGVRLDEGDMMRVKVPVASASTVVMDCDARTCKVNGATTTITLTSDWFELEPGAHAIRNDQGTGACTVSWYERWHR